MKHRQRAIECLEQRRHLRRYDAVLVDEGQDCDKSGLDLAWSLLRKGRDDFIIALNAAQNINEEMASVPDIDLDFPRDIREKLILRVYEHFGKEHVGLVATFPTSRIRSAVREVGKALGLSLAELDRLAKVSAAERSTRKKASSAR